MVATRLQNGMRVPYSADGIDHRHFVPQPRVDPRPRRQIRFWVDMRKELGEWAFDTMDALKQERKFKQTMLEGFRLVIDLRNKKIDYLFELFPWFETWMDSQIDAEVARRVALEIKEREEQQAKQNSIEAKLSERLAALEAKLAAIDAPAPALQPVAPRPLAADALDDVAVPMKKAAPNADTASSSNFLSAAFSLVDS